MRTPGHDLGLARLPSGVPGPGARAAPTAHRHIAAAAREYAGTCGSWYLPQPAPSATLPHTAGSAAEHLADREGEHDPRSGHVVPQYERQSAGTPRYISRDTTI